MEKRYRIMYDNYYDVYYVQWRWLWFWITVRDDSYSDYPTRPMVKRFMSKKSARHYIKLMIKDGEKKSKGKTFIEYYP